MAGKEIKQTESKKNEKVQLGTKRKLPKSTNFGDDLFTYGNQIKLTFSHPTTKSAFVLPEEDSDSSDDKEVSENREQTWERISDEEEELEDDEDNSEDELESVDPEVDMSELNDSQNSNRTRSPSPPPPVSQTELVRMHQLAQSKRSAREFESTFSSLRQAFTAETSPASSRLMNRSSDVTVVPVDYPFPIGNYAERNVTVKVRTRSGIRKFNMKAGDTFKSVIEDLAEAESVPVENILLTFKDMNILGDDTPLKVGVTVADIIECVVMASRPFFPDDDENSIDIKVRGNDAASCKTFRVLKATKLSKKLSRPQRMMAATQVSRLMEDWTKPLQELMKNYSEFRNLPLSKLRFLFDGDVIKASETAEDLDIENEDIIDVREM